MNKDFVVAGILNIQTAAHSEVNVHEYEAEIPNSIIVKSILSMTKLHIIRNIYWIYCFIDFKHV